MANQHHRAGHHGDGRIGAADVPEGHSYSWWAETKRAIDRGHRKVAKKNAWVVGRSAFSGARFGKGAE